MSTKNNQAIIYRILSNISQIRAFSRGATLSQLYGIRSNIDRIIEERRSEEVRKIKEEKDRDARINELLKFIESEGFDPKTLTKEPEVKKKRGRSVNPIPPKYRYSVNGIIYTWNGRGRRPCPIQQALDAGKSMNDFLIPD